MRELLALALFMAALAVAPSFIKVGDPDTSRAGIITIPGF